MFKVTSAWPHQDSIKVEWNLGKRCNYDCSYCPASIHDNTSKHTDLSYINTAIDVLASIGKPVRLSFTGGEPCVHPKFIDIILYAREKGIKWISVTTNGTLPAQFYEILPVDQYVISIHLEFPWERVLATVQQIAANTNKHIVCQIMAHHEYVKYAKVIRSELEANGIPNTVRRIRWTDGDHDVFDDSRYSPADLEWILNQTATVKGNCVIDNEQVIHANDIIKLHLNQYKGWSCAAGIESLMINWDGEVHRATCRVGGSLGNIYSGTFVAPDAPTTCTRDWCTCAADIPLTKHSQSK